MRTLSITLAALALSGAMAFAQDEATADQEPATEANEQTEAPAEAKEDGVLDIGETYNKELVGDWQIRCARAPIGQADPCDMFQLLTNSEDRPVAEISVQTQNAKDDIVADIIIVAPLGLLLPAGIPIAIDGREGGRLPFIVCNSRSCVARVQLKEADVAAFKAGNKAQLQMVPADRSLKPLELEVSLKGFTAAFNQLSK